MLTEKEQAAARQRVEAEQKKVRETREAAVKDEHKAARERSATAQRQRRKDLVRLLDRLECAEDACIDATLQVALGTVGAAEDAEILRAGERLRRVHLAKRLRYYFMDELNALTKPKE